MIDRAFSRLYNFDFEGTQIILQQYVKDHSSDPLGYAVRSAACLFSELHRLMILESEFLGDDRRINEKKKLKPDPEVKRELFQAVEEAQKLALEKLAVNPKDPDALFSLSMTAGVLADYTALIEKRQLGSLWYARQSHGYARRLLQIDPAFYDAYLTIGFNEYLIGSLPFFVRWFARFEQVQGSKQQAIRNLEIVAQSGKYLKAFAKILLAIIHLREKRPQETERLLAELSREYPENPLIRKELGKISARLRSRESPAVQKR